MGFTPSPNITSGPTIASGSLHQVTGTLSVSVGCVSASCYKGPGFGFAVDTSKTLMNDIIDVVGLQEDSSRRRGYLNTSTYDPTSANTVYGVYGGKVGRHSALFKGNGQQYLASSRVDNPSSLPSIWPSGTVDQSISVWVKINALEAAVAGIAGRYNTASGATQRAWFIACGTTGNASAHKADADGTYGVDVAVVGAFAGANLGVWRHIYAEWDQDSHVGIRVDGSTLATVAHTQEMKNVTAPVLLGAFHEGTTAYTMNGQLDQFVVWRRLLTTQEQDDMYNGGNGNPFRGGNAI